MKTMIILLLVLFLCSTSSRANDLYLSFGPSVDEPVASSKMLTLQYELAHGVASVTLEAGAYTGSGEPTFLGGVNAGLHIVTADGLTSRIGFGPALISKTDDRLSGIFEFHIQARMGLDMKAWETGVQFDHFSDGGRTSPNMGKDLISLYVGIPL